MLFEEKRSCKELKHPCEFSNRRCNKYNYSLSKGLPFMKSRLILHKQLSIQIITNSVVMLTQNCLLLEDKVKQTQTLVH